MPKRQLAWGSTADWFTHLAGTTRRQGKRTLEHAKRLVSERTATLAALRQGTVSPDQAGVIVDAIERLPQGDHLRRRGEQVLLEEAGRLNATDLHRVGRHLAQVVDPDRDERDAEKALDREDRAAHLGRHLTISDDGAGGIRVRGRGSVEDGATLRAALLPLTSPVPTADPVTCEETPDPRDHGARMWDALIDIAQHSLDTDLAPASHGARARVAVTIDHDTLHDQPAGTGYGVTDDGLDLSGSAVRRMACDCDLIRVTLDADADGGGTSLDNLVLLCGHHHRTIHHTPWQVRIASDRRPQFLPPPKSGRPAPEWIRHRPRRE